MFGGERGRAANRTGDEGDATPAVREEDTTPASREGGATSAPPLDGSPTVSAPRQPTLSPSIYHRHIAP